MIPETIPDITTILSKMAKSNMQEFFVQQAVQSKIAFTLVAKLSMGVASDLRDCSQKLIHSLPQNIGVKVDFRHYLKDRAALYKAIAHKYAGKALKDKSDFVTAAGHFRDGKRAVGFVDPKNNAKATNQTLASIRAVKKQIKNDAFGVNCLTGVEHSIEKQISDISKLEYELSIVLLFFF